MNASNLKPDILAKVVVNSVIETLEEVIIGGNKLIVDKGNIYIPFTILPLHEINGVLQTSFVTLQCSKRIFSTDK
jgi:hypothetical protein